jgi:hypothetical protein
MVITQLAPFALKWRRYGLKDEDLRALESLLMSNPTGGAVMQGTAGLRKIRFAPPSWHTGKSGATRVCYATFPEHARVYLVTLFAKAEKANLTQRERRQVASLLTEIGKALAAGDVKHA